jgi:RNA polymerase sigma-70 factor, ECF subfamily
MLSASEHPAGQRPSSAPHDGEPLDDALHNLYQAHAPALLTQLTGLTNGDRHFAEDVLQETLIRAWKHPEARLVDGRWSRAWLFTVARRIVIDHVRARRSRAPEWPDQRIDAYPDPGDLFAGRLDAREVRNALAAMPERLRSAVVAVYFQDYSVAEAAELLGVPPGTVKSRTFYALRALRAALIERGFGSDGSDG